MASMDGSVGAELALRSQATSTYSRCFQSAQAAVQHIAGPFEELIVDVASLISRCGPMTEQCSQEEDATDGSIIVANHPQATGVDEGGSDARGTSAANVEAAMMIVAASFGAGVASLSGFGGAVVILSGVTVSLKGIFVAVAVAMAVSAKSVLERIPHERRFKTMQKRCAVALGASSTVYMSLLLPAEGMPLLEGMCRPELVVHSACDAVASPLFVYNLSSLVQKQRWKAYPVMSWALASTGISTLAAADPSVGLCERLAMLGVSSCFALIAGIRAHQFADLALSDENRQRSHLVCSALTLSWLISPILQGVALFLLPAYGLAPVAVADVIFKRGITLLMLRSLARQNQAGGHWRALAIEYFTDAPPRGRAS